MKKTISHLLGICIITVLAVLSFVFPASAAGQVYTVSGKPAVFLAAEESITIDGTQYNTFASLAESFTALGADGGVIYIYGTVTDTNIKNETVPLDGTTARGHVLIRGWDSTAVLNLTASTTINAGPTTFENFTLYAKNTAGEAISALYLTGSEETVFGEGFSIPYVADYSGRFYYRAAMKNLTEHRSIFNSADVYLNTMNIGGYRHVFGSSTSETPALAELIFNDIKLKYAINAGFSDKADYQNRVYGNVNIYVNGGTFTTKQIALSNITSANYHTGVTTAIFNNGMNDGWTVADGFDYVVNSAAGGKVEIKTQAPFGGAPTFILTPEEDGKVPCIGGTVTVTANNDGEFLYTPSVPGTSTDKVTDSNPEGTITETIEVTWVDKPTTTVEPEVYTVNGKRAVFIADTDTVISDGLTYGAYPGLAEAFDALGTEGGVIYVCGTVHDSTRADLGLTAIDKNVQDREHVLIRGLTSDAVLHFYTTLNINGGPTTFENFTLYPTLTNGTADDTTDDTAGTWYFSGSEYSVYGDGFKIPFVNQYSGNPRIYYRGMVRSGQMSHRSVFKSTDMTLITSNIGGYRTVLGSSTSTTPALAEHVYDGIRNYYGLNAGFSEPADYQNRVYGNVNIYVNSGTFVTKQITLSNINEKNYHTGRTTAIFNNGMAEGWTVADGFDYVVKSAVGGTVEIKTQAPFGGAPTFEFIPDEEGYTAVINGSEILKVDPVEGNILYTPEIPEELESSVTATNPEGTVTEVIEVTWIEIPDTCVVSFDANGGSGTAPANEECHYGSSYTPPASVELTKQDAEFLGWNTGKYALTALESVVIPEQETLTLYAVWQNTGTRLSAGEDISDTDIIGFEITTIPEDEYTTDESVAASATALETDALNIAGCEICYAFNIKAYDENEEEATAYSRSISFDVARTVLPDLSVGECYVLYKADTLVDFTENETCLTFSDNAPGTYTIAVMKAKSAEYTYSLASYNKTSGSYVLDLYFKGAQASYGSFGLAYDTEKLELEAFAKADSVVLTGDADGFGTYFDKDGIYQNTWEAENGISIDAASESIKIGSFTFKAKSEITDHAVLFSAADFSDTEISLDTGVLETVYDTEAKVYLYAPMVPSVRVYCQPINTVFDFDSPLTAYEFTASVILDREAGNKSVSEARITILSAEKAVLTVEENDLEITETEKGKAVLNISASLEPGTYTLKVEKNGYLTYTSEFTVEATSVSLGSISLVGGDIKGSYSDFCGDGSIDIDDFVRVLRGFSTDATADIKKAVDINEDGNVTVTDLSIIKSNFGKSVKE